MHRVLLGFASALFVSAAVTAAQTPTAGAGPGSQANGSSPARSVDRSHVVMRGCVERADELVPAGSSPIGTTVDSLDFVLTHAEVADSPHPAAPAPTATTGTDAPGENGIGSMYRLDGRLETLNPQVGHQVEITGTREPSGTGAKPPSANAVNPTAANAPIVKVESVRSLSATCAR